MEENRITAITKEKTDVLTEAYKDALGILDAYDHQTLTRPEGTYYDGNETIEEKYDVSEGIWEKYIYGIGRCWICRL